jgi:glutaredoxin
MAQPTVAARLPLRHWRRLVLRTEGDSSIPIGAPIHSIKMDGSKKSHRRAPVRPGLLGQPLGTVVLVLLISASPGCRGSQEDSSILSLTRRILIEKAEVPSGDDAGEEVRSVSDPVGMQEAIQPQPGRIIAFGDASTIEEPHETSDAKSFFSYVGPSGDTRMVQGLHNVPVEFRATAKNLSTDGRKTYRYDGAARASTRRPRAAVSTSDFNPNRLDVTLFSAPWCGACQRTKKLLDLEDVDYELRDIDDDPSAREKVREILGNVRIPLLDVNGTHVVGYDRDAITRILEGG